MGAVVGLHWCGQACVVTVLSHLPAGALPSCSIKNTAKKCVTPFCEYVVSVDKEQLLEGSSWVQR